MGPAVQLPASGNPLLQPRKYDVCTEAKPPPISEGKCKEVTEADVPGGTTIDIPGEEHGLAEATVTREEDA